MPKYILYRYMESLRLWLPWPLQQYFYRIPHRIDFLADYARTEPIEPFLTAEYLKMHPTSHTSHTGPHQPHQPHPTRTPPATTPATGSPLVVGAWAGGRGVGWCLWCLSGWWVPGVAGVVRLVWPVRWVFGITYPYRTEPKLRNTGNT